MKASSGKKDKKSRKKVLKDKIRQRLLKFTPRQLKYRKNRLAGMSIYAAAREAGYSKAYAHGQATVKLEGAVKESIIDELEMAGFTNKRQARELTRIAFGAVTTEPCKVYAEDDEGNVSVEDAGREVPDNYARLKALEQGAKLKKQIAAPFDKTLFDRDFKRLVIVVENDTKTEHNVGYPGSERGQDNINVPAKLRVETTD